MKISLITVLIFMVISCHKKQDINLNFLIGKWQVNDTTLFEEWYTDDVRGLVGFAYSKVESRIDTLETLIIKQQQGKVIYQAKPKFQNNGRIISFKLNKQNDTCFSFENLEHDFPQFIQYKHLSKDTIRVTVKSSTNQGFTQLLLRR